MEQDGREEDNATAVNDGRLEGLHRGGGVQREQPPSSKCVCEHAFKWGEAIALGLPGTDGLDGLDGLDSGPGSGRPEWGLNKV